MRILVATPTFPPNKDGVSEAAAAGVKAFLDQKWDVDVATEPTSPARTNLDWYGARIYEFPISGSPYFRSPYRGAIGQYSDFLCSGDWDVIIFHSYSWPLYLAVHLLRALPSKKILVSHGYRNLRWFRVSRFPFGLSIWFQNLWKTLRMLFWIRRIDRWVFLHSKSDLNSFFDLWLARIIRHPGIRVIPNGVHSQTGGNPERFRKTLSIDPCTIIFLMVGYYSQGKDQGFAFRAFLNAALPHTALVFIGSEFNQFSERFQSLTSPSPQEPTARVIWLERQTRDFTLDAFAGCDIYVSSSYLETQSIAILEAMAERKPWIARDAGCISEVPGGLCVKSETEMTQAMKTLAQNSDLRSQLGQNGQEAVEKFYNRKMYNDSYCRLVEEVGG
jgi:glycosyltransferase involved in cell wall biosynthesis